MNNVVQGGTVPIVMSYRRVTKKPEIKRTKRFIGLKRIIGTLAHRAIEWVEELAYEPETEVLDAGESEVVHWALQVNDPWDVGGQSHLVVTRLADCPPCGMNFETVRIEEPEPVVEQAQLGDEIPQHAPRRGNHDEARAAMRRMLLNEGHFDPEAGPPPSEVTAPAGNGELSA
jgi:hypothetical protein